MAQSNFYGNDYDARYQANNYSFEDYGYKVKNISRSSRRRLPNLRDIKMITGPVKLVAQEM